MPRCLFGVYQNNTSGQVQAFANWLGANPDLGSCYTGQANASDYETSVSYCIGANGWPGQKCVSLPLLYSGITLAQAGSGSMDAEWTSAINSILSSLSSQSVIYLRTAWEFNGSWEIWASQPGSESVFVTAWQRWANIVRNLDTKNQCKIVWCPNIGQNNPAPSYPGNAYVDLIGMDFYWQSGTSTAFSYQLTQTYGINWLLSFAQGQGKPICFPEWGMGSNSLAQYCTDAVNWMVANDVVYANYWDSNSDYSGQLSNGQYPATGAAYQTAVLAAMSATSTGSTTATTPAAAATPTPPSATGATLTTVGSGALYDSASNAYTLVASGGSAGTQYAINGTVIASSSNVAKLAWDGTTMKQLNTAGVWYTAPANGAAGSTTSAPTATLAAASTAYSTLSTVGAAALYDSAGNAYTLVQVSATAGQQYAINGYVVPSSAKVTELEWDGSLMKQLNSSNVWYTAPANGQAGVTTTAPVNPSTSSTGNLPMAEINAFIAASELLFDDLLNANGLGASTINNGFISMKRAIVAQGGAIGAEQTTAIRTATTTAINSAIAKAASLGKIIRWDEGTYETNGPITITSGVKMVGDVNVLVINYSTNQPIMQIGSTTTGNLLYGLEIDGINLQYGVDQTGNTSAVGILMGGVYLSRFKNISIGSNTGGTAPSLVNAPYIGWQNYSSASSGNFSNWFENITINEAQNTFFAKQISGTGDTHVNMYFHNGSGTSSINALGGNAILVAPPSGGQRSDDIWIRTNVEWCEPASAAFSLTSCINTKFIGTHIEGVTLGGNYPQLVVLNGGSMSWDATEILDLRTTGSNYYRPAVVFQMSGYGENCDINRTWMKWSVASELVSALSFINLSIATNPNDGAAMVSNDNFNCNDNGTGNAAMLTLDPNIATPCSILTQCRRHVPDALMSTTEGGQFAVSAAFTLYGQHKSALIFIGSSITSFTLTFHVKQKASGTGSTMPTAGGTWVRVRRQSGTVSGTVTFADSTAGTINTNAASATDLIYYNNGTAWLNAA